MKILGISIPYKLVSLAIKKVLLNSRHHRFGKCNICGKPTAFLCIEPTTALHNMYCLFCGSASRKRMVAKVIKDTLFPGVTKFKDIKKVDKIKVYNADVEDGFYKNFHENKSWYFSYYSDKEELNKEVKERVFCFNLESTTFDNSTFDLVISEEVMEHVRDSYRGFKEIARILKPGGFHIFTIPFSFDQKTIERVDISGKDDIHLLPPEYHGGPRIGKILAYRNFGLNLLDFLDEIGFETRIEFSRFTDRNHGIFDNCFVFISKKVG